jgi:hypothetical protein
VLLDDPGIRRVCQDRTVTLKLRVVISSVELTTSQVGLLFIPALSTDSPHKMKRRTTTHRIDESDPDSYRRYKQWRASKSYNAQYVTCVHTILILIRLRNRAVRNEKTREHMTMLWARQRLEPPTLQAARLAARQESARKYREKWVWISCVLDVN